MRKTISIVYEARLLGSAESQWLPKVLRSSGKDGIVSRYTVTANSQVLHLKLEDPLNTEMGYEGSGHKLWIVDHVQRLYESPRPVPGNAKQRSSHLKVTSDNVFRKLETIEGVGHRIRIEGKGFEITAWMLENAAALPKATTALWYFLVPGLDPSLAPQGLPAELTLTTNKDILTLRALELNTDAESPDRFAIPKGYKQGSIANWLFENQDQGKRKQKTDSWSEARQGKSGLIRSGIRKTVPSGVLVDIEKLPQDALTEYRPASHFAWFSQPTLLDQLKSVLNRFARTQGSWRISHGVVNIDWWASNLAWHVNPDQPNERGGPLYYVLLELARIAPLVGSVISGQSASNSADLDHDYQLLLSDIERGTANNTAYRMVNGSGQRAADIQSGVQLCRQAVERHFEESDDAALMNLISGGDPERRADYVNAVTRYVARYVLTFDNRLKRVLSNYFTIGTVDSLLTSEMTAGLEDILFDGSTKIVRVGVPIPSSKEIEDLVVVGVDDIEGDVTLDHSNVVSDLSFYSRGMRATLTVPQVYLDFYWWSYPAASWKSVALAIVTGGLTAAELTHAGWGYANLDEAKLVFDLRPTPSDEPGQVEAKVIFRESASTVDSSAWAASVRQTLSSVVLEVGSVVASILDSYSTALFSAIAEALNGKKLGGLWPQFWWNAYKGPPAVAGEDTSMANWLGVLAAPNELPGRDLTALALGRREAVASTSYLFTEAYLTAWLRSVIGQISEDVLLRDGNAEADEAAWEQAFPGLDLPDPSTLPDPDLAQFEAEVGRRNVETYLTGWADALTSGNPLSPMGCRTPARRPNEYFYRTVATRSLPQVRFSESGDVDYAGHAHLRYEIRLEAVRVTFHQHLIGVSNTRCRPVPEDFFDFPVPADFEGPRSPLGSWGSSGPGFPDPSPGAEEFLDPRGGGGSGASAHGLPMPGGEQGVRRNVPSSLGSTPPDSSAAPKAAAGFPPPSSGMMMYCENPTCGWVEIRREHVLKTFARATVDLTAKVYVGFRSFGEIWPPQISIAVDVSSLEAAAVESSFESEAPVDAIGSAAILPQLEQWCHADASRLLRPLHQSLLSYTGLAPFDDALWTVIPDLVKDVLYSNLGLSVPPGDRDRFTPVLQQLLRFKSSRSVPYVIDNGVLYWPLELLEQSAAIIES